VANPRTVLQAHLVSLVCPATTGNPEHPEPQDKTLRSSPRRTQPPKHAKPASRRRTVPQVPRDPQAHLDSPETLAHLALAVVSNNRRHNRRTRTLLDWLLVHSVIAPPPSESTSAKLIASAKDPQARLAPLDPMDSPETRDHQESLAHQAPSPTDPQWSDHQAHRDHQAPPEHPESLAHLAHPVTPAPRDSPEIPGTLAHLETLEPQEAQDSPEETEAKALAIIAHRRALPPDTKYESKKEKDRICWIATTDDEEGAQSPPPPLQSSIKNSHSGIFFIDFDSIFLFPFLIAIRRTNIIIKN